MTDERVINLSSNDRKYLSTGCNQSHYPNSDVVCIKDSWRSFLVDSLKKGVVYMHLKPSEFQVAFPRIKAFYELGLFNDEGDVARYFEELGDVSKDESRDNLSHNVVLYREGLLKLNGWDWNTWLYDKEVCAIKVSDLQENKTWGFGGVYSDLRFDKKYFGNEINSRYVLTHGKSEDGLVVVRSLEEAEFLKFKSWFENVHKMDENIFVKHKKKLEEMLQNS